MSDAKVGGRMGGKKVVTSNGSNKNEQIAILFSFLFVNFDGFLVVFLIHLVVFF